MKVKADPAKKGHKQKTKHDQIHIKPTPAGAESKIAPAWA
jgi:hypothetical protein